VLLLALLAVRRTGQPAVPCAWNEGDAMARYKVLKSVAHNFGHSFTSLMNFADDDYVMGRILRLARLTGRDTLTIDFVKGEIGPTELLAQPFSEVLARYLDWFWHLVQSQGSDRSFVQTATMTLRYDIAIRRPLPRAPHIFESPYVCDVRITDIRGKKYEAHFEGWWHPERFKPSINVSRPWWKIWMRSGNAH
jgi:hypothetical protein